MKTFGKYLEEKNKGLWDNIHAKRKRGEKMRKPGSKGAPTSQDFKDAQKKESVEEKKLTPAELKKREEIAKAMERDNPGMDMSKKMAIATATAKRVAEQSLDISELSTGTLQRYKSKASKIIDNSKDEKKVKKRGAGYAKASKKLTARIMPEEKTSKSDMLCKECGDQFGKPTNEKCMYDAYDQLGENWVTKEMYEGLDITEISLDMLTKKISNSGMTTTKKANKMDKTKNDLAAMRARLAAKSAMAKEAYEDDEPASPDEASMAMRQLGFIEYAAEEVMDHIKSGKEFPEWMQNKLSKLHGQMESLYSSLGDHGEDGEDEMKEEAKLSKIRDMLNKEKKQRSLASLRGESVMSADKKPEKFVKPDGKVGIRMVRTDKNVVNKDA